MIDSPYSRAFLDWMACAVAGRSEPAPAAARAVGDSITDRVATLATAGHVLDFDDTYGPGLSHLSAPTAPAALVVGAHTGATISRVLDAYGDGFEAMADERLEQSEAILTWASGPSPIEVRIDAARGSPRHPMTEAQLDAKVHLLAGRRLDGLLDEGSAPAADVLGRLEEL